MSLYLEQNNAINNDAKNKVTNKMQKPSTQRNMQNSEGTG